MTDHADLTAALRYDCGRCRPCTRFKREAADALDAADAENARLTAERDEALAEVAQLRERITTIHTPTDQEVEVWADGPGDCYHDEFLCSDDPASCLGHTKTIPVCQECGYDHDDGDPVLREWPCPTVRSVLAVSEEATDAEGGPRG